MKPKSEPTPGATAIAQVVERARTQSGESIVELCNKSPVLLVFLRHAGCTFCREALADISQSRADLERGGARIVLVYMGDSEALQKLLAKYGLADLGRVCDPGQQLYQAFGLKRGRFAQLFGLKVLGRAFFGGALMRHGIGPTVDDAAQMPGVFLIHNASILRRFRHRSAADRPDYVALCQPDSMTAKSKL